DRIFRKGISCMTGPGKYRKASSWLLYLLLAGLHNTIAESLHAQDVSFLTPSKFSAGSGSVSSGVGDFNQDGNRDLAVANHLSGNVSILLGNGDGTFQPPVNFPVGGFPDFVIVNYFNNDSIQDLAVASSASLTSPGGSVSVLLGNGD